MVLVTVVYNLTFVFKDTIDHLILGIITCVLKELHCMCRMWFKDPLDPLQQKIKDNYLLLHISLLSPNIFITKLEVGINLPQLAIEGDLSKVISCNPLKDKRLFSLDFTVEDWELNKKTLAFCPLVSN